jgi:hypothetical protein
MPELPDVNAYLCALDTRIVGRTLEKVRVASAFVLRTAQPPIADLQGQVVRELRRIGKRVVIGTSNDLWVVIHLMIAGRLHWRAPGMKLSGRNNLAASILPRVRCCSPKRAPSAARRCTFSAASRPCAPWIRAASKFCRAPSTNFALP